MEKFIKKNCVQGAAGFWVSINRITTKWMLPGETSNTVLFFFASSILVGICFIINMIIRETDFVKYYIRLCQESRTKITLEPTEDSGLVSGFFIKFSLKSSFFISDILLINFSAKFSIDT